MTGRSPQPGRPPQPSRRMRRAVPLVAALSALLALTLAGVLLFLPGRALAARDSVTTASYDEPVRQVVVESEDRVILNVHSGPRLTVRTAVTHGLAGTRQGAELHDGVLTLRPRCAAPVPGDGVLGRGLARVQRSLDSPLPPWLWGPLDRLECYANQEITVPDGVALRVRLGHAAQDRPSRLTQPVWAGVNVTGLTGRIDIVNHNGGANLNKVSGSTTVVASGGVDGVDLETPRLEARATDWAASMLVFARPPQSVDLTGLVYRGTVLVPANDVGYAIDTGFHAAVFDVAANPHSPHTIRIVGNGERVVVASPRLVGQSG